MKRSTEILACLGLFAAGVVLGIPLSGRADGGSVPTCGDPYQRRVVTITSLTRDGEAQLDDLLVRVHTPYTLTATESQDRLHATLPSLDARVLVDFDAERQP